MAQVYKPVRVCPPIWQVQVSVVSDALSCMGVQTDGLAWVDLPAAVCELLEVQLTRWREAVAEASSLDPSAVPADIEMCYAVMYDRGAIHLGPFLGPLLGTPEHSAAPDYLQCVELQGPSGDCLMLVDFQRMCIRAPSHPELECRRVSTLGNRLTA